MKQRNLRGLFTSGVVATSLLLGTTTFAAVDMFLKIPGIDGESTDEKHKNEIDVLAWSWGGSSGPGKSVCVQDLSFTKYIDAATPGLIMNTVMGQVVPTATLVVRKAGEMPVEYLTLTMKNVTVSSYSTGGSGGEDRLTENVTLHFETLTGSYQKQDPKGGMQGPPLTWEVTGSKSCQ
jgi:type VI secretion system secreted protein Hcp